jgi:phage shock protein C
MVGARDSDDHRRMETKAPKIMRSRDDRMLGGVCGGIAEHFDIDPVIVRIATIALVCAVGAGAVAYVAAWILMPLDDRPAASTPSNAGEPAPA